MIACCSAKWFRRDCRPQKETAERQWTACVVVWHNMYIGPGRYCYAGECRCERLCIEAGKGYIQCCDIGGRKVLSKVNFDVPGVCRLLG